MFTNKNASDITRRLESRVRYANFLSQRTTANSGIIQRVTIIGGSGSAKEASMVYDTSVGSLNTTISEYNQIIQIAGGGPAPAPAPAPVPEPEPEPGPGIQILSNYDFIDFNAATGAASNWTSIGGWNAYNNASSNSPNSGARVACVNPLWFTRGGFEPLIEGSNTGFLIYSYNTDTVYQEATIDSLTGINYITCEVSARALEISDGLQAASDELTMQVNYYNSGNTIITTTSSNLTSALTNNFATYQVQLTRAGYANFDDIVKARVSLIGKDGGFWGGFYGPVVDYCSLTLA